MALPKKGTRNIVVDGDNYRYRIRSGPDESHFGKFVRDRILTVESPDGKVQQHIVEMDKITPKNVEQCIRKEIIGK